MGRPANSDGDLKVPQENKEKARLTNGRPSCPLELFPLALPPSSLRVFPKKGLGEELHIPVVWFSKIILLYR